MTVTSGQSEDLIFFITVNYIIWKFRKVRTLKFHFYALKLHMGAPKFGGPHRSPPPVFFKGNIEEII